MTSSLANPAHREFVHRFVDWKLVDRRRTEYPAIGRAFDLNTLQKGREQPPYFCHYMAWRLGTWESEDLFARFNELLLHAESLPNWKHERPLLVSPEFADFWSLLWQLQVAEYLATIGSEVQWAKSGPDLSVVVDNERWFVECFTPRKSFGLLLFLTELLERIDSAVRSEYDLCMPLQLPFGAERVDFLDTVFAPFLNPSYITKAKTDARERYPVVLYDHPDSSLRIYVEGEGVDPYAPEVIPNRTGSPEGYLKVALQEAANAKRNSNNLDRHRPNLVAVNYLLSIDFQLAESLRRTPSRLLDFEIDPAIDALAISVVGINERLTRETLKVVYGSHAGLHKIGELEVIA